MKKVGISLFILVFLLISVVTGCSQKQELPFTNSPENDIKIDYMEDILQDEEKYVEMYKEYLRAQISGNMSEEFEKFIDDLKNKSIEQGVKFIDNAEKWIVFEAYIKNRGVNLLEEEVKKVIDNYLRHTRLGDEEAALELSPEMEEQDPVGKVKKYMEDNNIKVTEIVFPEGFEDKDLTMYPFKFRYRYILKGTINNRPFEKEVVQDFYYGVDWSQGKDKMRSMIEYIRDVHEDN